MWEEITFSVNDTTRAIRKERDNLERFNSPICDNRIKAIILTKLQEAELLSYLLIVPKKIDPPARDEPAMEDVPF